MVHPGPPWPLWSDATVPSYKILGSNDTPSPQTKRTERSHAVSESGSSNCQTVEVYIDMPSVLSGYTWV